MQRCWAVEGNIRHFGPGGRASSSALVLVILAAVLPCPSVHSWTGAGCAKHLLLNQSIPWLALLPLSAVLESGACNSQLRAHVGYGQA